MFQSGCDRWTFLSVSKQVTKANPLKKGLADVHDDKAAKEKRKLQLQELEEMRLSAYESSKLYKGKMKAYHDKKILKIKVVNQCYCSIPGWDFSLES